MSKEYLMVTTFLKRWYGDFSREELKKYLILGVTFFLMIGVYWTLRPLKDTIFASLVIGYGKQAAGVSKQVYLAWAKVVSLVLLFPLVIGYSKLVDRFQKYRLFYVLGGFYFFAIVAWALFFANQTYGLSSAIASPWRISGWLWYVFVESFGSLVIALFWAFATDISDPKSAKRGFPLVYLLGQLGQIVMPIYLSSLPKKFGTTAWISVAACAVFIPVIMALIYYFVRVTPKDQLKGYQVSAQAKEKKEEPGFLEGLKLLLSHKYLLGIFAILGFFELISTIIDFNFKSMIFSNFENAELALAYYGKYAAAVGIVSFGCLALGINNITRWFGIRTSLALVPIIIGGAVLLFFIYPEMNTLFYIMAGAKAINYALNGPSIKQLYIPTSEDVKYKSQAWIETFGSRSSKSVASFINISKGIFGSHGYLILVAVLSSSVVLSWLGIAFYLGMVYKKAIDAEKVVC